MLLCEVLVSVSSSFVRRLVMALYLFHRVFFNPSFATVGKLNTKPTLNGAVGNVYPCAFVQYRFIGSRTYGSLFKVDCWRHDDCPFLTGKRILLV